MKTDHLTSTQLSSALHCIQPSSVRREIQTQTERWTLNSSARIRHINHSNRRRGPAGAGVRRFYAYRNCSLANCCRHAPRRDFTLYDGRRPKPGRPADRPTGLRSKPESKLSYRCSGNEARLSIGAAEIVQSNEKSATAAGRALPTIIAVAWSDRRNLQLTIYNIEQTMSSIGLRRSSDILYTKYELDEHRTIYAYCYIICRNTAAKTFYRNITISVFANL